MTDGMLYYWTSWFLWGIITFFMGKQRNRTLLAASILICLTFSQFYIVFFPFQVMTSFLILVVFLMFQFVQSRQSALHILATFTIIIGYAGSRIWFISTPLSLFVMEQLIISLFLTILICIMTQSLQNRLIIGLFGIGLGEFFYGLIAISYYMDYTIGNLAFFDQVALIILFILLIEQIKQVHQWILQKWRQYQYFLSSHYKS